MATVWVLTVDNDPDSEVFADFHVAFAAYREHIEERTGCLDWENENFEWETDGSTRLSCHCYGEFIARLSEVEVK